MSREIIENGRQSKLSWYYWRFRSMHPAEIPHRIIEAILKKISKLRWVSSRDMRLPPGLHQCPLPILPLNRSVLRDVHQGAEKAVLQGDADRLCANEIRLLQQNWPAVKDIDWALDPETGLRWSWEQYTHDIPRRVGQGPGDVKFVWELSRLQHLQTLAFAAHLLSHHEARQCCLYQLEKWLDDNPPYTGLGYACGIELASRVISILVVTTYLDPESIGERLASKIWKALAYHGRFIARFPSLYSSANNHLVAESAALFILGSVVPRLPDAVKWRKTGWQRLVIEAHRQVLPDGAGAEQSATYLGATLEWLLLSRTVFAVQNNVDSTDLDAALVRGATFISSVADVDGNVPFFGDRDDSVILRPTMEETNYLSSLVTSISAGLQRPEVMHPAFRADLRTHMITANDLAKCARRLGSKTFTDGGYSVIRKRLGTQELFLLFDHGPLGFAATAAHGHADALSVWIHLDGKPLLVDFGTYRYAADGGWRAWARSTAAHNTVEIGGESQSITTGPFNWGARAQARLIGERVDADTEGCVAEHSGYLQRFGVVHRRYASIGEDGCIEIRDSLMGTGTHSVRVSFHFAPDLTVAPADRHDAFQISRNDRQIATLTIDCTGLSAHLASQRGRLQPGPGAVSPGYNALVPSASVIATGSVELPLEVTSRIRVERLDFD